MHKILHLNLVAISMKVELQVTMHVEYMFYF